MSAPEAPKETEAQQIIALLTETNTRLDNYVTALNSVGGNVQWLVDNTQNLFKMFSNPMFMQQIMASIGGSQPGPTEDVLND